MIIDKLSLVGMQLLAKYKENFDVSSEGPINESLLLLAKAGERQPRAPGKIGEQPPPPVPLDSHTDGNTKVYFLIAIIEVKGIASELLTRNRQRISVPMACVACICYRTSRRWA
jgi:hypothetical protein